MRILLIVIIFFMIVGIGYSGDEQPVDNEEIVLPAIKIAKPDAEPKAEKNSNKPAQKSDSYETVKPVDTMVAAGSC